MKEKVLAYIFRYKNNQQEILVFDHMDFPEVNPQVIGGSVDPGESPEAAVTREIREESGLSLTETPKYLGAFHFKNNGKDYNRHVFSFLCQDLSDEWEHIVSHGEEDKGLRFKFYWLDINSARKTLVSDMGLYLN